MTYNTHHDRLINELYGELALSPKEAGGVLDKIEALATKRTGALAKIRDQTHRDYCRAQHTFDKYWREAWTAARDEVLAELGSNDEDHTQ